MSEEKTISLVLSSGGARGLAHIGVIRELQARGYRIGSIAGCSMGALVGGFHAAGKLDEYARWVTQLRELDVLRFLDVSLTARNGMMKGDLIMETLRGLIGDCSIEDLPIPFTAVATDIVSHREVWLSQGNLFDAIRASIGVPGIFTPHHYQGRLLVDGGLLNPIPVAPATDDLTELTIAVSVGGREVSHPLGPEPPAKPTGQRQERGYRRRIESFLDSVQDLLGRESRPKQREMALSDILLNMFDTMQGTIARYRLAAYPPHVLIEVPMNVCQSHEFYKAERIIAAGGYWARQALDQFEP